MIASFASPALRVALLATLARYGAGVAPRRRCRPSEIALRFQVRNIAPDPHRQLFSRSTCRRCSAVSPPRHKASFGRSPQEAPREFQDEALRLVRSVVAPNTRTTACVMRSASDGFTMASSSSRKPAGVYCARRPVVGRLLRHGIVHLLDQFLSFSFAVNATSCEARLKESPAENNLNSTAKVKWTNKLKQFSRCRLKGGQGFNR